MPSVSIHDLDDVLHQCIELAISLPPDTWQQQCHPDLSPAGWHIGHMVFIEQYWILEQLLGKPVSNKDKNLFFPWLSPKAERGNRIQDRENHISSLLLQHQVATSALQEAGSRHELMKDDYLLLFLVQHHHQHRETLHQIVTQHALNTFNDSYTPQLTISARAPLPPDCIYKASSFMQGNKGKAVAFDNELPMHRQSLQGFAISSKPVSCAEYLGFMEDDGYKQQQHWTKAGWQWRLDNKAECPTNWRMSDNTRWYQIVETGYRDLPENEPVIMISQHEARAYASWAGYRLPLESEWEYSQSNLQWGECWEWCNNPFYPYPGFRAFPYDGYSKPWFDDKHFTLRGASHVTSKWVSRPSFRNFYTADTRHIFSGLRLAS